jgi:hypothetical protein
MTNIYNLISSIVNHNQSTGEIRREEERKQIDKQTETKNASKLQAFSAYKAAIDKADKAAFSAKSILGNQQADKQNLDISAKATQARAQVMAEFFASPEGQILLATEI